MSIENVALIGYGYWGKKLYKYLKESEQFNLSYVYFPSLQHFDIASIQCEFGEEFVPSIKKIWEDKYVPNVIIATPIKTHYLVVRDALLHSKNVMIEKPLTTKTKDAFSLKDIAQKGDLKLMTDYTYTFSSALQYTQKLINEGVIGQVKSVYITIKQLGRFLDYDVFTLLGSHALSILDLFVPLNKSTFHTYPFMCVNGLVSSSAIYFESKEYDCCGYIDVSLHCPIREKRVIFYGEKGTIIYDPYAKDTIIVVLYTSRHSSKREDLITKRMCFSFDENNNLRNAIKTFFEVIQSRMGDNLERSIAVTSVLESLSTCPKNVLV